MNAKRIHLNVKRGERRNYIISTAWPGQGLEKKGKKEEEESLFQTRRKYSSVMFFLNTEEEE